MDASPVQSRSSSRKAQWGCVAALFVGGTVLGFLGVSSVLVACMLAAGAVWISVLGATAAPVVRRVPNIRGAILITGIMAALALSFYAYNTWQLGGHAQAMESPAPSP